MTTRGARPSATLDVETALWREVPLLAGMDEVGRGAVAGPVSVGVVIVSPSCGPSPAGLTDSKLLRPQAREEYVPLIARWCLASAVGHASAAEVDAVGIVGALRLAGRRALASATAAVQPSVPVPLVLLDGSHDWLSTPEGDLFASLEDEAAVDPSLPDWHEPRVVTRVKADLTCASVAAASVVAKVERDAVVTRLAEQHPGYGWERNKGYATADHRDGLRRLGPSPHHRVSWNLTGAPAAG
jgi:ribonuclease HII